MQGHGGLMVACLLCTSGAVGLTPVSTLCIYGGIFFRYSSFYPQCKVMRCRMIGISRLSIVCECVSENILQWVSTPSRESPGIDSEFPVTLCSGIDNEY